MSIRCFECQSPAGDAPVCPACGGLLEVVPDPVDLDAPALKELFRQRRFAQHGPDRSGVWRYRELVHPRLAEPVTRPEGNTNLYRHDSLSAYAGLAGLQLKHEGENPSGSFKDRGMTVAVSEAKAQGARAVICASTGNTAASLASYAAFGGLPAIVVVPRDHTAPSKLAQSMAFGARVAAVRGSFDDALRLAEQASRSHGLALLNSVNPWRIEGQKTIMFELLDQLDWQSPDWIVVPAGNLGNTSAFGKALAEAKALGLIDRLPRLASVQAAGAAPFYRLFHNREAGYQPETSPETLASAIRIGDPRSWKKALFSLEVTDGLVEQVSDAEILDAKAAIDAAGIGCEPASAASLAGAAKLRAAGVIDEHARVVCILTGNFMKDSKTAVAYHQGALEGIPSKRANRPYEMDATTTAFAGFLDEVVVQGTA